MAGTSPPRLLSGGNPQIPKGDTDAPVDAYIDALPEEQKTILAVLRAHILNRVPHAQESISYGMPAYKYKGKPLVYFGAAKHHVALYGSNVRFLSDAERAALDYSKGAIRFTIDAPLPPTILDKILASRVAEIDG